MYKFVIEWIWYKEQKQLFLGVGFLIGEKYIGWTISNLFIGIKSMGDKQND